MQMYFALVHHEKGSAFGVHFPDVPGCFSAADEEHEILREAQTALLLHLEGMKELPTARSIEQLTRDQDVQNELSNGAFMLGVPLVMIEKKSRFNLMLEPSIVQSVDELAKAAGVSRSEFISDTLEKCLSTATGAVILERRRSIGGSTGGKVASSAGKVLASKTASKAEKTVAASALTQKGSTERTSSKVASAAAKVIKDPKASKEARSAAASALTQKKK